MAIGQGMPEIIVRMAASDPLGTPDRLERLSDYGEQMAETAITVSFLNTLALEIKRQAEKYVNGEVNLESIVAGTVDSVVTSGPIGKFVAQTGQVSRVRNGLAKSTESLRVIDSLADAIEGKTPKALPPSDEVREVAGTMYSLLRNSVLDKTRASAQVAMDKLAEMRQAQARGSSEAAYYRPHSATKAGRVTRITQGLPAETYWVLSANQLAALSTHVSSGAFETFGAALTEAFIARATWELLDANKTMLPSEALRQATIAWFTKVEKGRQMYLNLTGRTLAGAFFSSPDKARAKLGKLKAQYLAAVAVDNGFMALKTYEMPVVPLQ